MNCIKFEESMSTMEESKSTRLEEEFKKIQPYMLELEKLTQMVYTMIKNKFDEKDGKQNELKQLLSNSKDPIKKGKETYKEALVILKNYYEVGTDYCEKSQTEIDREQEELLKLRPEYLDEIHKLYTEENDGLPLENEEGSRRMSNQLNS